ncbi:MAG: hypothetical protein RJB24_569 [Candidatus Parcubacteria bacterium]|jgi:hypothetical protein
MKNSNPLNGILHPITEDISQALEDNSIILDKWNQLTPIQRNEWICWITIVKKSETRLNHIQRMLEEIQTGNKTPCCWPGCPHRNPKAQKWFGKKGK